MGSRVCRTLKNNGHRVWGIDRNTVDGIIRADITDYEQLKGACQRVRAEAGNLDGIIHTAGIYDLNSLVEMSEADFTGDFDVNLFGIFRVNRVFLPLLKAGGRIVIVSSELAPLDPLPFTGIYAITKTAVESYAKALRMELHQLGYRVIIVRPGAVNTGMLPVSTEKLESFCAETELYKCNAVRFRDMVNRVEANNIEPEKVANVICKALKAKRPRLLYCVNRNPLLLTLNALPERIRLFIIRKILEPKE